MQKIAQNYFTKLFFYYFVTFLHQKYEFWNHSIRVWKVFVIEIQCLGSRSGRKRIQFTLPDLDSESGSTTLYFHYFAPLYQYRVKRQNLLFMKDNQCRYQLNPINPSTCLIFKLLIVLSRIRIWIYFYRFGSKQESWIQIWFRILINKMLIRKYSVRKFETWTSGRIYCI